MFENKKTIKSLLFLTLILFSFNLSATDVTAIRSSHNSLESSNQEELAVLTPVTPNSKKGKKKKRKWFKRFQGKMLEKKLAKLLPELYFDSLKCDIIVLKSGEEIEAKILEVNTGALVYELCGQENGPKRTLLNSKVSMIEYSDGFKEKFRDANNESGYERDLSSPKKNTWAIGFALGILLGLLGVLLAYIIYKDDRYARKKAISGALVGILAIVLLYLYILSTIA